MRERCVCLHAAGVCMPLGRWQRSMDLCLGRKLEKPNEDTLLECYKKRRNRRAQLSMTQISLIGGQQKMKDWEGDSTLH